MIITYDNITICKLAIISNLGDYMNKIIKRLDKDQLIEFVRNRKMRGKAFLLSSDDYDMQSNMIRVELYNDFNRSDFLIKHKDYLW